MSISDDGDDAARESALLEHAKRVLDSMPPELVRDVILSKPGLVDATLDAMRELAKSDDAEVRDQARDAIEKYGLELLLVDEADYL